MASTLESKHVLGVVGFARIPQCGEFSVGNSVWGILANSTTDCAAVLVTRRVSEGQNTTSNNPSLTLRVTKAPHKSKVSAIPPQPTETLSGAA
jgi:hypothetical protein